MLNTLTWIFLLAVAGTTFSLLNLLQNLSSPSRMERRLQTGGGERTPRESLRVYWRKRLIAAGNPITLKEYERRFTIGALGGAVFAFVLTWHLPAPAHLIITAMGCGGGVLLPELQIRQIRLQRQRRISRQIREVVLALQGILQMNNSLDVAFREMSRQVASPCAEIFARAADRLRLSTPLARVLADLRDEVEDRHFHEVFVTLEMQQRYGGKIADALGSVLQQVQWQKEIDAQTREATSTVRYMRILAPLMPIVALVLLGGAFGGMRAWFSAGGIALIVVCVLWMALGEYIIRRSMRIHV